MKDSEREYVESQIGYTFENKDLLEQAFTRKSYSDENESANNEIMEFAGDKIIDFIVTKRFIVEYGYLTEDDDEEFNQKEDRNEFHTFDGMDEGYLTKLRISFVSGKNLAAEIDRMGFKDFLRMGSGDVKCHAENQQSIKEDLFEAIVGAVAIDCCWDMETLESVLDMMLSLDRKVGIFISPKEDYVALVQTWHQKKYGNAPFYEFKESYLGRYQATLKYKKDSYYSTLTGEGLTKSHARYDLAKKLYLDLDENHQLISIREELGIDNLDSDEHAINILQELAQKGYCSKPVYTMSDTTEYMDGHLVWTCTCTVDSCIDGDGTSPWNINKMHLRRQLQTVVASSTSKKIAKKFAAYCMLCQIFRLQNIYKERGT